MHKLNHPLAKISLPEWKNMRHDNVLSEQATQKIKYINETSLANEEYRLEETKLFHDKISKTTIHHSPVFVIGHWRSGTTHLQNLLTQDDRFGYLSVVQSLNPHAFLMRESIENSEFEASKRFMDNVILRGSSPSEEEVAMGILAKGSFWRGYYLTDKMDYYFKKYTLFENIDIADLTQWKKDYIYLLKKLTYRHQGKPLFLKNPPNTCRIKMLFEMFPTAKFVHIRRNPYKVYFSRMKQFKSAVKFKSLQEITEEEWESKVFEYYKKMMSKHFEERALVPEDQYIELSFENLRAQPIEELKKIYKHLNLPNIDHAESHFNRYLNTLKSYVQNDYQYDSYKLDEIYSHWHFTIDKWAYDRPE